MPKATPGLVRCSGSIDAVALAAAAAPSVALLGASFARPKSRILACPRWLTKMFAGLVSRWTMPSVCAASSASVVDEAHKLSYEETLTELIREARKYGVGILLASQSVKDFDRIVFDMVGTKVALQLEGDDAKVISENLGLVDKQERDIARRIILNQAPHVALVRSNHFEPYIQVEITPFYKKK